MRYYVILDTNALLYRYGFGYFNKENYNKEQNGALFGIFSLLLKIDKEFSIHRLFFCFDTNTSSHQNKKLFDKYKSTRPKMPDFLFRQLQDILFFCKEIGMPVYQDNNFEGDDVIFTLTKKILEQTNDSETEILIISTDKDLLQIMNLNHVSILLIHKIWKLFLTKFDVWNYLKIMPKQIPDWLALAGDPSDNIPGLKNVGKKTAIKLLETFENIENLLNNVESITQEKLKTNIKNSKTLLLTFKTLTTLKYIDYLLLDKLKYIDVNNKAKFIKEWLTHKAGLEYDKAEDLLLIFER